MSTRSILSPAKASPVHGSNPTPHDSGLIMSPPSHHGHTSNRFQTMLPLGLDARQAIPPSSAPSTKPDVNRVYAGMNVGVGNEDGRRTWWRTSLQANTNRPSQQNIDINQLGDGILNEIEMELEVGHFSRFVPILTANDLDAIRRILQREAVISERDMLGPGHAHLVARILVACDRDEKDALDMFALIASKLRTYESDAPLWSLLRNDVLRLTEFLLANTHGSQLCQHFNQTGFDLVDLADVVVTWFAGLFTAAAFPTEYSLRCIDILLLPNGGPEQLVGVLYGTLHVLQMKLLECQTSESLFASLTDLPSALTKAQIGEVFAQAFWMINKCTPKNTHDWQALVAQVQGPLRFQSIDMLKAMSGANASLGRSASASVGVSNSSQVNVVAPIHPHGHATMASPIRPPGHAHSSSMTFNLSDYSPDARTPAPSSTNSSNTDPLPLAPANAAIGSGPAAAVKSTTTVAQPVGKSQPHPSDTGLIAELAAASSSSNHQKTPAQLQALLDRALVELRNAHARLANNPTIVPITGKGTNSSSIQSSLTVTPTHSSSSSSTSSASSASRPLAPIDADVSRGIRTLSSSIYQIAPIEVHPLDRSSSSSQPNRKVVPPNGLIKYSELLEYQLYPCLLMQGYLMKSRAPSKLFKRTGSSGFFGNLHRRYFVLQGSFLTYFKSHEYNKPTRDESVDLRTCVATKIKNHEYGPFAFKIESKERGAVVYLLFASNETVRDVWLECLAQATQTPTIVGV